MMVIYQNDNSYLKMQPDRFIGAYIKYLKLFIN